MTFDLEARSMKLLFAVFTAFIAIFVDFFCCRLLLPAAEVVPVRIWRRPATEGEVCDPAIILGY
jgi:hypothetical protein